MFDGAPANDDRAGEYLMFVSGYVYRLLRYEARDLGIRWTALMVLKDLDLLGALSQRTLADIEQMREPTMTVLLQQMRKRRWIRRRADPSDARVKLVEITSKGRRELTEAGRYLRRRLYEELAGLSRGDLEGIEKGLRPLVELLDREIAVNFRGAPGDTG